MTPGKLRHRVYMTPQTIEGSFKGKSPNGNAHQLCQEPGAHFVIGSRVTKSKRGKRASVNDFMPAQKWRAKWSTLWHATPTESDSTVQLNSSRLNLSPFLSFSVYLPLSHAYTTELLACMR